MAITFEVAPVERNRSPLGGLHSAAEGSAACPVLLGKRVEAYGSNPARCLPIRQHGLLQTVRTAFDQHYPLVLTPDAIWLCIAQGFAAHVTANAEQLRGKFVRHEGQATLEVRRDDFVKGSAANPWPEVFPSFSDQIAAHIGRQRDLVVCDFSTTGPCERAASEIVLMDAMQKYFKYVVSTSCGIPAITLEGSAADYRSVRRRVQALGEYELGWWVDRLLPVVDHFIAAAEGRADVPFWQSIYNREGGSGGPYVTGWINALFPYYKVEPSAHSATGLYVNSWFKGGEGLAEGNVPSGLSVVPFLWKYFDREYPMQFLGGFVGMAQDESTLALRPAIGWAIRDAARPRPRCKNTEPTKPILLAPGGGRVSQTYLIAGRVSRASDLTIDHADLVTRRLDTWRGELGFQLSCYIDGGPEPARQEVSRTLVPGRLLIGVEIASAGSPPRGSKAVTDLAEAHECLRDVPSALWEELSELLSDGLDGDDAVHLFTFAGPRHFPAGVRATLVFGEPPEQPGDHVLSAPDMEHLAVRGVKVAEARSQDAYHAIVEASPAAHAERLAAAQAVGVTLDEAAYYLIVERC